LSGDFLYNARNSDSKENFMKPLLLALAIVFAGVVVTFWLLSALAVPQGIAGSASSVFLGAISYVHKQLDIRSKRPIPAFSKDEIVNLKGFVLPNAVVLCYGLLLGFAAIEGVSGFSGLILGVVGPQMKDDTAFALVALLSLPLQMFCGYLVARWIGVRSGDKGIWFVIVVFSVVISAEHLSRPFILGKDVRETIGAMKPVIAWMQWGGGLIIWNVLGLLGFWRGRRIQLRRYADYLLKKVTSETRGTVLSLLRDEVAAINDKTNQGAAAASSGASPSPA
jgi:hypothetical protein